jgi:cytochrome c oxidase cbb3-type subunit 3
MSVFESGFWDLYIAVITVASIAACAVFLKMQSVRRPDAGETSGHVWDGDLTEYNNPLPRWWAWLFYLTIGFSLVYLVLFPGLGSYPGTLGWTQVSQLEEETRAANARFGPMYDKFAVQPVEAVARDAEAIRIGQKLFLNHCAQCHAADARGGRGFPNLADRDWLYGGEPEAIKASITGGRNGVMPALGATVGGDEGAKDLAHYLFSLSGRTHDGLRAFRGKAKFQSVCAACHGMDGKGNRTLGAPNLTDDVWLYGGAESSIIETILKGRGTNRASDGQSVMPAHKGLLSPAKIHLLTGYVYSLSQDGAAPER